MLVMSAISSLPAASNGRICLAGICRYGLAVPGSWPAQAQWRQLELWRFAASMVQK